MDVIHKINALRGLPASHWMDTANARLPGVVSIVLVIAIGWYLARLLWVFVPQDNDFDWSKRAPSGSSVTITETSTGVNFGNIVSAHLFGEAGAEPLEPQGNVIDAPETRLNLKLRGTIAAGDEKYAHAIIGDGKGEDGVYFIKDSVPGGAVLHEIYPDRVILNRAGALETLRLPRISEATASPTPSRQVASRPPQRSSSQGSIQQMMQQLTSLRRSMTWTRMSNSQTQRSCGISPQEHPAGP